MTELSKAMKEKPSEELVAFWRRIQENWKEEEIRRLIERGPRPGEPFDEMVVEAYREMVSRKLPLERSSPAP